MSAVRLGAVDTEEPPAPGTKVCHRCEALGLPAEHPLGDFGQRTAAADGRQGWCRECQRAVSRERTRCERAAAGTGTLHAARTSTAPRVTDSRYQHLLHAQAGTCLLCQQPESMRDADGRVLRLTVYYYRQEAMILGLLCRLCNLGLQMFRDDPAVLARATALLVGAARQGARREARLHDRDGAADPEGDDGD